MLAALNFMTLIVSRLMLVNVFGVDSKGLNQRSGKEKKKLLSCSPVLHKTWNWALSRCSRATTAKKCTKKRDARAKLFSLPLPSSDLKLPIIEESGDKESDRKAKKVLITANQPR